MLPVNYGFRVCVQQSDVIAIFETLEHAIGFALQIARYHKVVYVDGPRFGAGDVCGSCRVEHIAPAPIATYAWLSKEDAERRAAMHREAINAAILEFTCKELATAIVEYERGELGPQLIAKGARP